MTSLPPLLPQIREDLGLSSVWLGVLTTLPVLCMGLLAPAAARLGLRLGVARCISIAMVAVAAGNLVRGFGHEVPALYLGTLCAGAGIALAGTLLPGMVKSSFPAGRAGLATGLQMFAMMGGAAVAAAITVPLSAALGDWNLSLAFWGLVALVGAAVWAPVDVSVHRGGDHDRHPPDLSHRLPWRSRTAWLVAAFLAVQSWQFYSTLAWLSPTYVGHGWDAQDAGLLLSVFTGAQFVSGLVGPAITDRVGDWRIPLVGAGLCGLAGQTGVWAAPDAAPWLWAVLLGTAQGAAFAVGLVLLVRYAVSPAAAARFTAMAFLVSYTVASMGPTTMGAVRDLTGGYSAIWLVLACLMFVQLGGDPGPQPQPSPRPLTLQRTSQRSDGHAIRTPSAPSEHDLVAKWRPLHVRWPASTLGFRGRGGARRAVSLRGGCGTRRRGRRGAGPRRGPSHRRRVGSPSPQRIRCP